MLGDDTTPILIEVKDGRWDAYSMNLKPTARDEWLLDLIKKAGGINEAVEDGMHLFTAVDMGNEVAVTQLTKLE